MAASNLTQVGIEGMVAAQSNFQEAVSSADREASNVDTVGQDLTSTWTGEAAVIYQGALAEWQRNWNTCRKALMEMQNTLQQTTQQYQTTHQDTMDTANQTRTAVSNFSGLPGF